MGQLQQDIAFIAIAIFVAAGVMTSGPEQAGQIVAVVKVVFGHA